MTPQIKPAHSVLSKIIDTADISEETVSLTKPPIQSSITAATMHKQYLGNSARINAVCGTV